MYCVTVRFEVAAAHTAAFLARMRQQAADSLRLEPGCRAFEVWSDSARPGIVHLHEVYDDAAAFDDHLASAHFKAFDTEVRAWVKERTIQGWDTPHDIA